jgi:hypothetical protein
MRYYYTAYVLYSKELDYLVKYKGCGGRINSRPTFIKNGLKKIRKTA